MLSLAQTAFEFFIVPSFGRVAKHHVKGKLVEHVEEPYTYMDELEAHEAELERQREIEKNEALRLAFERKRLREERERALLERMNQAPPGLYTGQRNRNDYDSAYSLDISSSRTSLSSML